MALFYELRYGKEKTLQNYFGEIDSAAFAGATSIRIDWLIIPSLNSEIIASVAKDRVGQVSFSCGPAEYQKVRNLFPNLPVYIYFNNISELKSEDIFPTSSKLDNFVLVGDRRTEFEATVMAFQKSANQNLFFYFAPFNSQITYSLSVREVASTLKKIKAVFPTFKVLPVPGLELAQNHFENDSPVETSSKRHDAIEKINSRRPNVSVIIPTYNSKYFLLNVLKHLLAQKNNKELFEIIIVDDGSTDNSRSFILSFLKSESIESRVRYYYWPKPKGCRPEYFRAGQMRNFGASVAKGEILLFLDSDMILPQDFLSKLEVEVQSADVIQFVRHHIRPAQSSAKTLYEKVNEETDVYIEEKSYWKTFFETEDWNMVPFHWKFTCTYCLAIKRSLFFEVGKFKNSFQSYGFEDTDLGYRLAKNNCRFYLSKQVALHLTAKTPRFVDRYARLNALRTTAKVFFLLNLDTEIYDHFRSFMGGERSFIPMVSYFLGKHLKRIDKKTLKTDILFE